LPSFFFGEDNGKGKELSGSENACIFFAEGFPLAGNGKVGKPRQANWLTHIVPILYFGRLRKILSKKILGKNSTKIRPKY
jgi:hypothetical protein